MVEDELWKYPKPVLQLGKILSRFNILDSKEEFYIFIKCKENVA